MIEKMGEEWYNLLKDEFDKQYMQDLRRFLVRRRRETTVYPSNADLFTAYRLTPYSNVKVCIIGQDPYIRKNEAHGLAFSTHGKSTPSLRKIAEAIGSEAWSNDLTKWAEQGVFLLNRTLTVDEGNSGSHIGKGWEEFTQHTIELLSDRGDVIFLLWGSHAHTALKFITGGRTFICEHPAAAVYQGRAWDNRDCFNTANGVLKANGKKEIIW